jgi:hypothetical protein
MRISLLCSMIIMLTCFRVQAQSDSVEVGGTISAVQEQGRRFNMTAAGGTSVLVWMTDATRCSAPTGGAMTGHDGSFASA